MTVEVKEMLQDVQNGLRQAAAISPISSDGGLVDPRLRVANKHCP
jgi:hypothetical protein